MPWTRSAKGRGTEFSTKTVDVCGRGVPITGSNADPYFRSIDAFADQLAPLH
jgi:hypothetical protein